MFVVPLKFMCSTQCETPVRPGRSSFEPTLYQHHTDASGAVCTSWISTFIPLSRRDRVSALILPIIMTGMRARFAVAIVAGLVSVGAAHPIAQRDPRADRARTVVV